MARQEIPVTPGVRHLREKGIPFVPRFYTFEEHGGTAHSASALEVPEHEIVKTLVMQTDAGDVLIVLMHGDCEVSTKQLARILGVKHVEPCDAAVAQRHTGYQFGGTSPFGTRRPLPVFVERTILDLRVLHVNGGKRGFLVTITPADLRRALDLTEVDIAVRPIPRP
jgi:Cys-tRNA(Pro) deacylase